MLFNSKVPEFIKENLRTAKEEMELARIEEAENRLAIYEDDGEAVLASHLAQVMSETTFSKIRPFVDIGQNLFRRIVNDVSTVYNVEAERPLYRVFEEDDPDDPEAIAVMEERIDDEPRWTEILENLPYDILMQTVNRLTNALNVTAVLPVARNGEIELDIMTPCEFAVQTKAGDITRPISLVYELSNVNNYDAERVFAYWDVLDEGHHFVLNQDGDIIGPLDKNGEFAGGENPYKDEDGLPIIPAAFFWKEYPRGDFWLRTQGLDLYSAFLQINGLLTWLNYLCYTQSFKQIYAQGADVPLDTLISPQSLLSIYNDGPSAEGQPVIGTLDLQSDPTRILEVVKTKISHVANNWGLSLDNFTLSADKSSGFAMKLSNASLNEARRRQLPLYRRWESKLFEVVRVVNNAWANTDGYDFGEIPWDVRLRLDPGEVNVDKDDREEYNLFRLKMNDGLESPINWMLRENPELTRNEAVKLLQQYADERNQLRQIAGPNPQELRNAIQQRMQNNTGAAVGNNES